MTEDLLAALAAAGSNRRGRDYSPCPNNSTNTIMHNNITNLTSPDSKMIYLLGFFSPNDFYYAHLLEHYLAIELQSSGCVDISHANIGGGYIYIDGLIVNRSKLHKLVENISHLPINANSINHQRKIVLSEIMNRNRYDPDRDIYESLETNSESIEEKNSKILTFLKDSEDRLEKKIQSLFASMKWVVLDEKSNLKKLNPGIISCPKYEPSKFHFSRNNISKGFVHAEVDITTSSNSKIAEFILYVLSKRIFEEVKDASLLFGAHDFQNRLSKTWGNRYTHHYSGYLPKQFAREFTDFVTQKYKESSLADMDEKLITTLVNEYIKKRGKREAIMELVEYGQLLTKNWTDGCDLDNITSLVIKNAKAYRRILST